jgi:putative membrane-bound dehydrogenase-like protein
MGQSSGRSNRSATPGAGGPAQRLVAGFCALLLTLSACASAGSVEGARAPGAERASQDRLNVLFLGDNGHHQPWQRLKVAKPGLASQGLEIVYTDQVSDLREEVLSRYDALMIYGNQPRMTDEQLQALLNFIRNGGGLVAVHSASASFQDNEEFVRLVGGAFKSHGEGTFRTVRTQPDHPAVRDLPEVESWDETYVHSKLSPDNVVLAVRRDQHGEEPWTWVRNFGQGRVFYTAWGHDQRTWSNPAFQQLLAQGTKWAAGDWALAIRPPQPPAGRMSLEVPLPYYPAGERWGTTGEPIRQAPTPIPAAQSQPLIVLPPGFRAELFAEEPMVVNPIDVQWDARGRLWALETVDYPNDFSEDGVGNDRLVILEDTNGNGRADRRTVFAEGLNIPTSFVFANGGVIVAQAPNFVFLKDTSGDDRADVRQVIMGGWGTFDTHAGPSNLRYGFDNQIWGAVGYSAYRGLDEKGDSLRFGQAIYRFRPDGSGLEHVASFSNNTWGLGFNETFDVFGSTANNTHAVYVGIPHRYSNGVNGFFPRAGSLKIDGHYEMRPITPNIRQVDVFGGFTSAAGFNLYTARSFPREYWNRVALVSDPTGHLLHRAILERNGAGYLERDGWNLLAGAEFFSQGNELDQDSYEISNDLSFTRGDHRITVGAKNELFKFRNLFWPGMTGQWTFNSLDDFAAGIPNTFQRNVAATPDVDPNASFRVNQVSLYGQTEWSALDNLVVTAGLRYDHPMVLDDPIHNPAIESALGRRTDQVPSGNGILSPRLGFNWDVYADQTTQVRGGAGIFTGRHPFVWLSNVYSNTGLFTVNVNCSAAAGNLPASARPAASTNDIDSGFYVSSYLRSWAFESQLREYLREQFGSDWFRGIHTPGLTSSIPSMLHWGVRH